MSLAPSTRTLVQGFNARTRLGLTQISLLAIRGERAFFRLSGGARTCFAGGTASVAGAEVDSVSCAESFPSATQPILNFSIFEATASRPAPRLVNLRGIAADGVVAVEARSRQGDVVATTAVVDNVFHLAKLPSRVEATVLVALNAAGEIVYESSALRNST